MLHLSPSKTAPSPAPDAVRDQLQTLLDSPAFAHSPRLSRFLSYVVEETLAGRGGELKEYKIGVDVFQRPDSYDPKADPVVRVEARQLRFKLAEYYKSSGHLSSVVISIPKGAYAAWFEAATPSPAAGLSQRPAEQPAVEKVPVKSWRWVVSVPVAVLAIAMIAFVAARNLPEPAATPSIAVLPFVNLSGDPANEYFADGLTDEITDALARSRALRIIARSSAFQFKGKNIDARQTGRELNVSAILTGSVSRSAGRVKVLAQLARSSDGSVEWSRRYERAESDLFALQASLASDIAASLRVTLTPAVAPAATRNTEAQDFFMRARYEADQLTRESLRRAIRNYQQAIMLDPGYAAAHYGLAVARHRLPAYANDNTLFDRAAIEQEYQKAAELDPNYSDPHTGLALLAAQNDWDWARAERELETASAIGPSAMAEGHSALLALIRGRPAEVADRIRRARDLDPLGTAILMNTSEIQVMAGEYQGAREVLDRFLEQHPGVDNARLWIAISYVLEGKPEEALVRLRALQGRHPDSEVWESAAQALAGHRNEALRLVQSYEKRAGRSEAAIAVAYASLGDEARTLEWLSRSVDRREPFAMYLTVNPAFRFLRGNRAFEGIVHRAGLGI